MDMKRTTAPAISPRITPQTKITIGGRDATVQDLYASANNQRDLFQTVENTRKAYAILCALYPESNLRNFLNVCISISDEYNLPLSGFGECLLIKRVNQKHPSDKMILDCAISNYANDLMKPLNDYERTFIQLSCGFKTGIPLTAKEISEYYLFDKHAISEHDVEQIINDAENTMRSNAKNTYLQYVGYCDFTALLHLSSDYETFSRLERKLTDAQKKLAQKDAKIAELTARLTDTQKKSAQKDAKITELATQLTDTQKKLAQKDAAADELTMLKAQLIDTRRRLNLASQYGYYAVITNDQIGALFREELEKATIDELNLTVRGYNVLRRAGCNTITDVQRLIRNGILKDIRNCGPKTVEDILDKVNHYKTRYCDN